MPRVSLAARAALAVGLMIGFYVLALGVAGGLLWIAWMQVVILDDFSKLTALCVVIAGLILWAILPRVDRFTPPGPLLSRERHPRLFAELESVARATGQSMPREVYLVPELNAWVAQRGGVMAFGSRRVMGLGLALMEVLTVSEMRAVIAHEFGHYHGGDTKLGPWIHKTRAAIGRTIEKLDEHAGVFVFPFLWYGNMFLRITHAVSRRQEFAADELAARTCGAGAMSSGLRKIHAAGDAFDAFWTSEVVPAIHRGFRPPLAAGFRRFLEQPSVAQVVTGAVEHELAEGQADPFDTHPSLRERVAALGAVEESGTPVTDDRPALALIADDRDVERTLLDSLLREEPRGELAPLEWDEAGEKLWLPLWREQTLECAAELAALTPESLPSLARDLPRLATCLGIAHSAGTASQQQIAFAVHVLGAAVAILLRDRGFAVRTQPGAPVRLERGELVVAPFEVMRVLAGGDLSADAWRARCETLGIVGAPLAAPADAARSAGGVTFPKGASPVSAAHPPRDAADSKAR